MKSQISSKFGYIQLWTAELAALERRKNPHRLTMGKNVVTTLAPSFLIGKVIEKQ